MSALCQLETSCRVPGHGLHGRKCIAVAADSAAKIKNTKPGPLAITVTYWVAHSHNGAFDDTAMTQSDGRIDLNR